MPSCDGEDNFQEDICCSAESSLPDHCRASALTPPTTSLGHNTGSCFRYPSYR